MKSVPVFDFQFDVAASRDRVCEFHRDTRALKRLTPPPTVMQIHQVDPMGEGSISRFTLWLGPLPIHWTASHHDVGEGGFTDVQVSGPVASWRHEHRFESLGAEATRIHEHIEFEHGRGCWGLVTRVLFSRWNLWSLFTYRRWVTRRALRRRAG